MEDGAWTLFSPSDTPDLHDLTGSAFEARYEAYEAMADRGELTNFRRIRAADLWRKMLSMVFETGHPWITFKDSCNLRSPQQHVGVVHSSNLCTEITLNTSEDEIAVCNLGSVNLAQHTTESGLDMAKLEKTVRTAVRMLDNVIDINYYSVPQARRSNMRHRPVGLGLMGFQDALYKQSLALQLQRGNGICRQLHGGHQLPRSKPPAISLWSGVATTALKGRSGAGAFSPSTPLPSCAGSAAISTCRWTRRSA